jgi:lipoprotein-anchoring transpeptidase ErfK/SrfK
MEPNDDARILERRPPGQDLAFIPDAVLRAAGWLRRVYGGFVRADEIRASTASTFAGEPAPKLPLAFVVREDALHQRYDRAPILSIEKSRVVLPDGELSRDHVRVARARARPAGIPDGARWVHVSLIEQVLVAYDGDMPAFATLVSTGLEKHPTPTGLYRVYHKEIHASMHGDPPEPYYVDEVPFVQYFRKGISLHGTFWHDRFGTRASHGCVNLSMSDAQWLFDWAPPQLPIGWHAIQPQAAELPSLWVLITH